MRFSTGVFLIAWAVLSGGARAADGPWPLFAFCMDVQDAAKRTLPQQAELLKELGYAGAGHLWLDNVAERIATLDAAGLKLFQIYLRVDLANDAQPYDPRLAEVLPLLKGRDTMLALLIAEMKPSDPAGDPMAVAIVRRIADAAAASGVRVALYPHVNDWLERVEDGLRIVKQADRPNVGVMFNLCHWLAVDDEKNLKPLLASAAPRLIAVSLHGTEGVADARAKSPKWIQPLDSGSFDMLGLLKILREVGYKGPIGLQCYGIPGDARDHLARSMAAWRSLMQRLAERP